MISTIIPALNAERFLAEAIESAVRQSLTTEVIVVDDGSTDKTAEIAKSFSAVRYIYQEHAGLAVARNRGVQESRGKYLAFLDADDIWVPGKLQAQSEVLGTTDVDMVFGRVVQFRVREGKTLFEGAPTPAQMAGTLLLRRSSWDKLPGFNPEWRVGEFVDWCIRAKEAGLTHHMLESTLLFRRLHENNMGSKGYGRDDFVKILKDSLDRRRAATAAKE